MKEVYRVDGKYDLTNHIAPGRPINWHAEKHLTKHRDNLLMRVEHV